MVTSPDSPMNTEHRPAMRVLVVVHPGSACGSANFALGRFDARAARDGLVHELDSWRGGVVVVDGALSDELPDYPTLHSALANALARNGALGHPSHRIEGDDPDQVASVEHLASSLGWVGKRIAFSVTGAWYSAGKISGCVGSVIELLREMGFDASPSEYALTEDI